MPLVALGLLFVWFLTLFVLRSWIQWQTTGSTGIKGFDGKIGSVPWLAGVAATLGLALAPVAPLAALWAWPGGELLPLPSPLLWFGAGLVAIGTAGGLVAQLAMGPSWRIGVDESEETTLVTHGPFSWVRNPIFSFITLSAAGLILLVPNLVSVVACVLTVIGIELQVRAVEEPYLLRTHGDDYRAYTHRVGRFVPGFGRLSNG